MVTMHMTDEQARMLSVLLLSAELTAADAVEHGRMDEATREYFRFERRTAATLGAMVQAATEGRIAVEA